MWISLAVAEGSAVRGLEHQTDSHEFSANVASSVAPIYTTKRPLPSVHCIEIPDSS